MTIARRAVSALLLVVTVTGALVLVSSTAVIWNAMPSAYAASESPPAAGAGLTNVSRKPEELFRAGNKILEMSVQRSDTELGLSLIRAALDAGYTRAAFTLGRVYLEGAPGIEAHAVKASIYLDRAVAAGDGDAPQTLGRALLRGEGLPVDAQAGTALLEKQIAAGRRIGEAAYLLGSFYLKGGGGIAADEEKARSYLEKAVDADHSYAAKALVRLGSAAIAGELGPPDAAAALAFFERALEAGEQGAAVMLARVHLYGQAGSERDIKAGMQALTEAADAGNGDAARKLIDIHVRGLGKEMPKSLRQARVVFQKYSVFGDPDDVKVQKLLIQAAAQSRNNTALHGVSNLFMELPQRLRRSAARMLFRVNKNAAVHVVQAILKSSGYYDGRLSGLLTSETIAAINRACRDGTRRKCASVPLHADTIGFIAENFS